MSRHMPTGLRIKRSPRYLATLGVTLLAFLSGIFFTLTQPIPDAQAATPPDTCFAFTAGTGTITNYYNNESNNPANPACPKAVDIPATIGGVAVTKIGANAFASGQLTGVTIPSSVTSIGNYAFDSNQLTDITVPSSVISIGHFAFAGNKLTDPVILGNPTGPNPFQYNSIETISYNGTTYTVPLVQVTPPDECFSFNASTGTITAYRMFDLTLMSAGLGCMARDIIIPGTIGGVPVTQGPALNELKLTGVVLPDSITSEVDVGYNNLTSLKLPSSLTYMSDYLYVYNSLRRLTIPAGVTMLEPDALHVQSPWGADVRNSHLPNSYIYTDNPAVAQHVYDNIWYVRAYTADSANPYDLRDSAVPERWETTDLNQNGSTTDPIGGHIINPASTVVRYVDTKGNTVAPEVTVTGIRTGKLPSGALDSSDYLHSYLVTESAISAPQNPYSPTTEETSLMQEGFAQYYRMGDVVTFAAKHLPGYSAPPAQTVTLDKEDNSIVFTYTKVITTVPFATSAVVHGELVSSTQPQGVHIPTIAYSSLSLANQTDGSPSECSSIESAHLVTPSAVPTNSIPQGVQTLGGAAFSVSCSSSGSTGIDYALGSNVKEVSKLRVFKYSTVTKELVDITNQVAFSTTVIDGEARTVISYDLTDGGELDEDGMVNGAITDPIVIGYAGDVGELASTGVNMWVMVGGGVLLLAAGTGVILQRVRRG